MGVHVYGVAWKPVRTSARFLLQPWNVRAEITTIVIWEAGCHQIRLPNYKLLFLSREI